MAHDDDDDEEHVCDCVGVVGRVNNSYDDINLLVNHVSMRSSDMYPSAQITTRTTYPYMQKQTGNVIRAFLFYFLE